MSRFLIPIFLFLFVVAIPAQNGAQIAETKCHAFRTVEGRNYTISVVPDSEADAVLGIGFDPGLPMVVINGQGAGRGEVYRIEAESKELQVCVYLNQKGAKHTFAVIDDDQGFPFYMWSANSTVALETDEQGFISAFRFHPKRDGERASKAVSDPQASQYIAASSGILYTFKFTPGPPLDFLLVPETNHLDLAIHVDVGNGFEVVDFNRSANDIRETYGGQIEWFQAYPTADEITVVVANKSSYGGRFKMAARNPIEKDKQISPTAWRYLDPNGLAQFVDATRVNLPLISDTQAVTYEFTPSRLIEEYGFEVYSLEPGLEFALFVRTDPNRPPLFLQAGGESKRYVSFYWKVIAGEVYLSSNNSLISDKLAGFPIRGKIQISIVGYGGTGRVGVSYKDADRLTALDLPPRMNRLRAEVVSLFSTKFAEFEFIHSNFRLYRFAATDGESYNVKVSPEAYFDAVIMDPSGRTPEHPAALELVDEHGWGQAEEITVTARGEVLEFAVAGTRYVNGRVSAGNKRLGGTGYFRYEATDQAGTRPRFLESVEVGLPNEFVSNELNLLYQPWDGFKKPESSEQPPFPYVLDKKITAVFVLASDPEERE